MSKCLKNHDKNKYTIKYYSNKWNTYDCEKIEKRIQNFEPLLKNILKMNDIKNAMNVLDIGTGPGTIPLALLQKFNKNVNFKIYGIDPSPVSISIAKKIIKEYGIEEQITYKIGSFEKIPFPENFFDLVISNASFNLCTNKTKGIDEIARVVKKHGRILIADCFKKEQECHTIDDDQELWAHCISGAITMKWLISNLNEKNIFLVQKENLTNIVTSLILDNKWKWKEFIEYNMEYYSLLFDSK